MKHLLFISFMLLGIGQTESFAQGGNNDDIYFNSSDLEMQKREDKKRAQEEARRQRETSDEYTSTGESGSDNEGQRSYGTSYESDGYIDYEQDDYYATRIRRFNYPFYNMGYFSPFYNPYWYDPFWSDPYWGWSPWSRPGLTISFGMGPYWTGYWGWYNWYGFGGFGSYWNYPLYASWWGPSYYSGYWNGYYAGLYNDSRYVRNVTYGPRTSTNYAYNAVNSGRTASGLRIDRGTTGPRPGLRMENERAGSISDRPARTTRSGAEEISRELPGGFRNDRNIAVDEGRSRAGENRNLDVRPNTGAEERPRRGQFMRDLFGGGQQQAGAAERPMRSQPSMDRPERVQPRFEQRSTPRFEPQRSAPSFERSRPAPSFPSQRSMPAAPSRSGGSFGGGRR